LPGKAAEEGGGRGASAMSRAPPCSGDDTTHPLPGVIS
jgi:hypothetical protein